KKIKVVWALFPRSRERPRIAERTFVSLRRSVIVRVHHHRIGAINNVESVRFGPARVFVVLGVLQFFQETAPRPDVFANAAADHAEKMLPVRGFTFRAETTFVIARVNRLAVRTRNLFSKNGGGLRVLEVFNERTEPVF